MMPELNLLIVAISSLIFTCAVYVLGRAIGIPYELKTDRLWKLGEEESEPDDPEREDLLDAPHEIINLTARRAA